MTYVHVVRQNPNAPPGHPDPFAKVFRIGGTKLVSATDMMDRHLFGEPKNLEGLPGGQVVLLIVDFRFNPDSQFEHLTEYSDWVGLCRLRLNFRLTIVTKPLTWASSTYVKVGGVTWAGC